MEKKVISLIIPTVPENYKHLTKCVTTFCNNKDPNYDYQFCIVPNNWTGYEPNVNKALQICTGDYILFTNDDVWIKKPGWEQIMIDEFKEGVGMVSGTGYSWNDLPSFWFVMISKEVFKKIGLLDESFVLYSSDHDYGMRVKKEGYKIKHLLIMEFIGHIFSATSSKVKGEKELMKNMVKKFEEKWGFSNDHRKETNYINIEELDQEHYPGFETFTAGVSEVKE